MATLTVYPDADPESATVDGTAGRASVDETFATIRGGAGTQNNSTSTNNPISISSSGTSDQFSAMNRGFTLFDTSALTADATISNAVLSLAFSSKNNELGAPVLHATSSAPASNTNLVNGDYAIAGFGSSFGSIAYADVTADSTTYNDITLSSPDNGKISKTSITKLGLLLGWDINNSFTGTWASGVNSRFNFINAETAGTSADPKLVVTYSTTSIKTVNGLAIASVKTVNGLA